MARNPQILKITVNIWNADSGQDSTGNLIYKGRNDGPIYTNPRNSRIQKWPELLGGGKVLGTWVTDMSLACRVDAWDPMETYLVEKNEREAL